MENIEHAASAAVMASGTKPASISTLQRIRKIGFVPAVMGIIAADFATMVSGKFNSLVRDALATVGIATAYHLLRTDNTKLKSTVATRSRQLAASTRTVAARNRTLGVRNQTIAARNRTIATRNLTINKMTATIGKYRGAVATYNVAVKKHKAALIDFKKQVAVKKLSAVKAGRSMSTRTSQVAKREILRIPAKLIPYVGSAIVVAGVVYDLQAMCSNMRDLNTIYESCGLDERVEGSGMTSICNPQIPFVH